MKPNTYLLILVALGCVACADAGPVLTPETSYLNAVISGAVQVEYHGDAHYGSGYHDRIERDLFNVWSTDVAAPGWLAFMAFGSLELPDGVPVELEAIDPNYPSRDGETVVYYRGEDSYVSHEGTWTVEYLPDDLIRGTFQFRAFRYCVTKSPQESCAVPEDVPHDAVWIEVTGEFLAVDPPLVLLGEH